MIRPCLHELLQESWNKTAANIHALISDRTLPQLEQVPVEKRKSSNQPCNGLRYHETMMKTIRMEPATGCISDQFTVPGLTCPSKARRWRIWFCHFVVWLMPLEVQMTWFSWFSQMPSLKNGDALHGHCGYWIAFPIRKYQIWFDQTKKYI